MTDMAVRKTSSKSTGRKKPVPMVPRAGYKGSNRYGCGGKVKK